MSKLKNIKLDSYEKEIEQALGQGKFKRAADFKQQLEKLKLAAKATLEKKRNINIRISEQDMFRVKSMAARQGIPYQTLLSSLIHQYSNSNIDYNVLREPKKKYPREDS